MDTKKPIKLSFIIVAYNAGDIINNALESLSAQDYPHDEIQVILIDGVSSDNTKQRMLDFRASEVSFAEILIEDNPGKYLACGWNVALKKAVGEIILRVDAHTRFPVDFISKNVKCIESGQDICGGRVESIIENKSSFTRVLLEAENSMFGGGFSFFRRGEQAKYTSTLAFAAYKKKVFDKTGEYNEKLVRTEDNDMHYRMRRLGYKFFFNPDIVSYRLSRNSFKSLLKQKFLNGYWVGKTIYIQPKAFSFFYFVPLAFILALIILTIFCIVSVIPLTVLAILYSLVLILSILGAIKKGGFYKEILLLPFIIFFLHVSYGIGTIKGILSFG